MDRSQMFPRILSAMIVIAALGGCLGGDAGSSGTAHVEQHQALIWDHPYPHLVVDVDYVEGREPSKLSLDALAEILRNVTDKNSISIETPEPVRTHDESRDRAWTLSEVDDIHRRALEHTLTTRHGTNDTAVLHLIMLNGHLDRGEGHKARGIQFENALVVFPDGTDATVRTEAGSSRLENPAAETIERSIVIHELGHALGLVNNGAPMLTPRLYDDACHCHSKMEDSVMYGGASPDYASLLEYYEDNQWVPYKFDEYDLADLEAVRQAGRADGMSG